MLNCDKHDIYACIRESKKSAAKALQCELEDLEYLYYENNGYLFEGLNGDTCLVFEDGSWI